MARVEWTRRTPEEVEAVIGIALCRENPRAQRVRPGRGDGGVDIYIPEGDGWVVYQVKSFTESRTSSHERQITKSWSTLKKRIDAGEIAVKEWFLLRPLNPTPSDETWLAELTAGAGFPCGWKGLDFCDRLAADNPSVIDYYLHDGKERLRETIADFMVAAGLASGEADPTAPTAAIPSLEKLHEALNRFDPHFRFDFSVDTIEIGSPPPRVVPRAGLVGAATRVDGTRAITFRVYARFDEATLERPVPGRFIPDFEPGSPEWLAWEDFIAYGIPVDELPVRQFTIDMPGGLGATEEDAVARLGPARLDTARPFDLHVAVIDPSGLTIAETVVHMEAATTGLDGRGLAVQGVEEAGVFDLSLKLRADGDSMAFNLRSRDLTGAVPAATLPGLRVLSTFVPDNQMLLSLHHGPPLSARPMPIPEALPGRVVTARITRICEALAEIQRHTVTPVRVPDLTETTNDQVRPWLDAARLLRGDTITGTWNNCTITFDPDVEPPALEDGQHRLETVEDITIDIAGTVIDLGHRRNVMKVARLVTLDREHGEARFEPGTDDTFEIRFEPQGAAAFDD